jgi:LysM repeat protein
MHRAGICPQEVPGPFLGPCYRALVSVFVRVCLCLSVCPCSGQPGPGPPKSTTSCELRIPVVNYRSSVPGSNRCYITPVGGTMDLHRSSLLSVVAVLLLIVLRADVQASGYPVVADTQFLTGHVTSPISGAAAGVARSGDALSTPARVATRTPVPSSRTSASRSSSSSRCTSAVTARPGDTVSSIASRCGVSTSNLASQNRISPSSTLGVGQTLTLSSARPRATPTPTRVPARPTRSYGYP